jgi:hypothetical protein
LGGTGLVDDAGLEVVVDFDRAAACAAGVGCGFYEFEF